MGENNAEEHSKPDIYQPINDKGELEIPISNQFVVEKISNFELPKFIVPDNPKTPRNRDSILSIFSQICTILIGLIAIYLTLESISLTKKISSQDVSIKNLDSVITELKEHSIKQNEILNRLTILDSSTKKNNVDYLESTKAIISLIPTPEILVADRTEEDSLGQNVEFSVKVRNKGQRPAYNLIVAFVGVYVTMKKNGYQVEHSGLVAVNNQEPENLLPGDTLTLTGYVDLKFKYRNTLGSMGFILKISYLDDIKGKPVESFRYLKQGYINGKNALVDNWSDAKKAMEKFAKKNRLY